MVVSNLPVSDVGFPLDEGQGEPDNVPCTIHILTGSHELHSQQTRMSDHDSNMLGLLCPTAKTTHLVHHQFPPVGERQAGALQVVCGGHHTCGGNRRKALYIHGSLAWLKVSGSSGATTMFAGGHPPR